MRVRFPPPPRAASLSPGSAARTSWSGGGDSAFRARLERLRRRGRGEELPGTSPLSSSYKRRDQQSQRAAIAEAMREQIDLMADSSALIENADALDAAVCVLAGSDFLSAAAHPPAEIARAQKEGWIWVRSSRH